MVLPDWANQQKFDDLNKILDTLILQVPDCLGPSGREVQADVQIE